MAPGRRTVIVGAGQAGRRCAEALRELDAAAEILLLGEEPHPPYDRPPLSKAVLLGGDPGRVLFVRGPEFYAERRIALRTGTRVAALDLAAKAVVTAAGERIGYDSLVLATGASARPLPVPGADDPRVRTLRRLEDAEAIRTALGAGSRLAVVGGGLIGLEVAASARQLGCAVAVLEAADRLMARCVPPAIGELAAALHRERGVALHLSCAVRRIEARGPALLLEAGAVRVEAELVVVGIGGVADTALAEAAGLAVRDGILADACGRTSRPDVYAAGEVARFAHPFFGGRAVRLEAWQVAQNQPLAVARAICGVPQPYDEVPWHWTDQFDRNIQVFGAPEPDYELVQRPTPDGRLTALAVDAEGRPRGAVLVNNGREATPVRRLIAAGRPLDLAALRDPTVPLRALL